MILQRPAAARGHAVHPGLDSRHSFSFGHYHDPAWMGFGPLRVINEDRLQAGAGFPPHRHANMEILSVVLSGALAHTDDAGHEHLLKPGEVQWMSAGHGIEHSEYNGAPGEVTHFLQIWIQPDRVNATPAYAQRGFDRETRRGRWQLLASPDGSEGSLAIRQQACLRACVLDAAAAIDIDLVPTRRYWLQLVSGAVTVADAALAAGDALGFVDEARTLPIEASPAGEAELLLFDLPR